VKSYGVMAADKTWVQWLTLISDGEPTIGWTEHAGRAYRGTERECKAVSMLVPLEPREKHPLTVRR